MHRSKNHFSKSLLFDAYILLFGRSGNSANAIQTFQYADLKAAYRNAVKATHPDSIHRTHNQLTNSKFRKVTEAYTLLSDFLLARETAQVSAEQYSEQVNSRHTTPHWSQKPAHVNNYSTKKYRENAAPKPRSIHHRYFDGLMPTIALKTGLFLYYSGKISYEDLIQSLVWQRNMRPPIGELAVQWKWLHEYFVSVILGDVDTGGQFGERAVKMGLLKEAQVKVLLRHQLFMQKPLGHYFIINKILTNKEIKESMMVMSIHNKLFADERHAREQRVLECNLTVEVK